MAKEIIGKVDSADSNNEAGLNFTRIPVTSEERKKLKEKGYKFCYTSYWVTNLTYNVLIDNKFALKTNNLFHFDISIESFPEIYAYTPEVSMFFKSSFQARLNMQSNFIAGSHLRILVATDCEDCAKQNLSKAAEELVIKIRFLFGKAAALYKSLDFTEDIDSTSLSTASNELYIFSEYIGNGYDVSAPVNLFYGHSVEIDFPKDVEVLFKSALESKSEWQRFLFFWLAIEAKIGPSGKERKNFCLYKLKSSIISDELIRLHRQRVKIVHFGDTNIKNLTSESALWFLRIACIKNNMKMNLAEKYENWIKNYIN